MCNCTSQEDFSSSNIQKNGCPFDIPSICAFYDGQAIPQMNINTGDKLTAVIKKIAIYLGALNASLIDNSEDIALIQYQLGDTTTTTSTSTLPTTTTTTTSTSTTTTSSTSSTSTTTSSTTTTTTTLGVTSLFYVGQNDTGTAPNSSAILAGLSSTQNETADVNANWTSFNATPHYLWFAIKVNGVNSAKNKWQETVSNYGSIGTGDDLFGALTTVTVSGTSYYVGITNYATQFAGIVTLSKI